jgi:hypothetical protein
LFQLATNLVVVLADLMRKNQQKEQHVVLVWVSWQAPVVEKEVDNGLVTGA